MWGGGGGGRDSGVRYLYVGTITRLFVFLYSIVRFVVTLRCRRVGHSRCSIIFVTLLALWYLHVT